MIAGRFRDDLPRISLELPGIDGAQEVEFVLDTGFDGDLSLPEEWARRLPNAVQGTQFVNLAGGFQRRCPCYEIEWEDEDGELRLVEVLVMDGNPLMGTSFLRNRLLSIELIEGGEVMAESL